MSKIIKLVVATVLVVVSILVLVGVYKYDAAHYNRDDVPDKFVVLSHEYVSSIHVHEYVVYDKFTKQEYLYLVNEKYHTDALLLPLLDSEDAPMFYKVDN